MKQGIWLPGPNIPAVFMLDTTGKENVLHSFTDANNDGAYPPGGVVRDEKGKFKPRLATGLQRFQSGKNW